METGSLFQNSSKGLETIRIKHVTPDLQGDRLYPYTMEASKFCGTILGDNKLIPAMIVSFPTGLP